MISAVQLTNLRSQCGAPGSQASPWSAATAPYRHDIDISPGLSGQPERGGLGGSFHRTDIWFTIQLTDGPRRCTGRHRRRERAAREGTRHPGAVL
jgi:hypothetical protein